MSSTDKKKVYFATMGLLLAAIIWGYAFVVVKDSLEHVPSGYMLAFRFTIASICMVIIFHKRLRKMNKIAIKNGVVLGSLLFAGYYIQTIGCSYTTAGKNAFLTTVYVVIVPFLHWMLNKKKPDIYCIGAAFTAIAGIGLLSLSSSFTMNIGDVLSLLCGLGYAFHMIYVDKYTKAQDPILLTVLQVVVAAALSWLIAGVTGETFPMAIKETSVMVSMLYLGVFGSMTAFVLQNVGQKYTAPSTAALFLSMEAVFGVLFSILFLREHLTMKMLSGCILIFVAVIMAETKFEFITKHIKNIPKLKENFDN